MVSHRSNGKAKKSKFLTTAQAARLIFVHPNTLRKWAEEGRVTVYRVGPRQDRRFNRKEIMSRLVS
ncbi:excisionase family DNA-binding protein [Chloroflexota bacterium]